MVRTLRNLGSCQWCALVMNQHEQHRGAKLLSKSHKKVSPALCPSFRSRWDWLKAFAQNPPLLLAPQQKLGEKRGERWNRKGRAWFSLWILTSGLFFPVLLLIWFLFKEANLPHYHFHFVQVLTEPKQLISKCWGSLYLPGSSAACMPISAASCPLLFTFNHLNAQIRVLISLVSQPTAMPNPEVHVSSFILLPSLMSFCFSQLRRPPFSSCLSSSKSGWDCSL